MARSSPEHVPPEKMDNIMRAAVVEFARYPFNTASYNRIIRSAGLSKGAMYHYFSSKEDLFRLIMGATVKGLKPLIKPGPLPHDEQLYWLETERLLDTNKSPSRKVGELDNRGSHFYLALYWARELAAQDKDQQLRDHFAHIGKALLAHEEQILEELTAAQGAPVDLGGYYKPDPAKREAAMRPSATLNGIIG